MLGGVCAGLADYYSADVLPFRLVFVLLAAASLGIFCIVYLVCVIVWPKRDDAGDMYEVRPHRVDSSAYGSLSDDEIRKMTSHGRRRRADAPRSVGHIPPVPPRCFVARYGEIAPFFAPRPAVASADGSYLGQSPQERSDDRRRTSKRAVYLVLAGMFLLTLLLDYLAQQFVRPMQAMGVLPLFFVLVGISALVIPSRRSLTPARIVDGCALVVAGLFASGLSIGALSTNMLQVPALTAVLVALAVLVAITLWKRPRWLLAAIAALTVALAVMVFGVYAQPGPVEYLQVTLPLAGTFAVPLH